MDQKQLQKLAVGAYSVRKSQDGKIVEVRRYERGELKVYRATKEGK